MKGLKLNTVVASILSLGIICSGSVFASKIEGTNLEKPSITREETMMRLKARLDMQLKNLYKYSSEWNRNLMNEFRKIGFMKTQVDAQSLVDQITKDSTKLLGTLEKIRSLLSKKKLKNELSIVKDIVKTTKHLTRV